MRKPSYLLAAILCAVYLVGCNAMNDNPVDANKMSQIRHQEAAQRGSFHPSGTSPAASTAAPGK